MMLCLPGFVAWHMPYQAVCALGGTLPKPPGSGNPQRASRESATWEGGWENQVMRLPAEIDRLLCHELKAQYQRNPVGVTSTLAYDKEALRFYLGTYWPRSFVESHYMMCSLLQIPASVAAMERKERIRILDIGSGTGGNLTGLLWSLREYGLLQRGAVEVVSIDGNVLALARQIAIVKGLFGAAIQLHTVHQVFTSREDLEEVLPRLAAQQGGAFDIVISSKFVNEFYRLPDGYIKNQGMYASLLKVAQGCLYPEGVIILIDVNDKCAGGFFSEVLNREVHQYMTAFQHGLVPILPVPCLLWHDRCTCRNFCFSQASFGVSHTLLPWYRESDSCKVAVKVMAPRPFARVISHSVNPQCRYTITWSPRGYDSCCGGVCYRFDRRSYANGYWFEPVG